MLEDLYSTRVLTEVINRIKPDPKFFLDYFPSVVTHESDTIYMDETEYSMTVMPYAHPRASAKIMEKENLLLPLEDNPYRLMEKTDLALACLRAYQTTSQAYRQNAE